MSAEATTTMARTFFNKQSLALVAAVAFPFVVSACYAVSIHARTNTRLQDIADNAALAGVNSLAAHTDQPADARSAAAIAAARTIIETQPGIARRLQPSVEELTMSVIVEDIDKGTQASATAKYIPAKDSQPARQAINPRGYTAAAL